MYENLGNFIDGQWSNNTKEKVEVFNPFNEGGDWDNSIFKRKRVR